MLFHGGQEFDFDADDLFLEFLFGDLNEAVQGPRFGGTQVSYLYFYDTSRELATSEIVVQLQDDLRQRLGRTHPGHSICWVSDGATSECKGNDYR